MANDAYTTITSILSPRNLTYAQVAKKKVLPPVDIFIKDIACQKLSSSEKENNHCPGKQTKKVKGAFEICFSVLNDDYCNSLPVEFKSKAQYIEFLLKDKKAPLQTIKYVRARILFIINQKKWDFSRKYSEIGLLFYYIAHQIKIPNDQSLLQAKCDELEQIAVLLKENHKSHCNGTTKKLFPSGAVFFILHDFVRMIFPWGGHYNVGGCYAVKQLLNTEVYFFLSDESRTQILTIVDRLIEDQNFRNNFKEPFEVHPELEQLILIDQKIPLNQKLDFNYVRWDLLLTLFFVIGQINEGNCYAVACDANALLKDSDVLLQLLIEVLKKRTFSFQGVEIPILTLLESKRKYEKDFNSEVEPQKAQLLIGYSVACKMVSTLENSTNALLPPTCKLNKVFENHFGSTYTNAKEIFFTFKQNLCQQILLSVLHFISLNTNAKYTSSNGCIYISWRSKLFKQFKLDIFAEFIKIIPEYTHPEFLEFMQKIYRSFEKRFFLVDFKQWEKRIENEYVRFDFHEKGLKFEGPPTALDPFMKTRRLFFLNNGKFFSVDSFSVLSKCFKKIIHTESTVNDTPRVKKGQCDLKQFVQSSEFKNRLAQLVTLHNSSDIFLPREVYIQSNSFFLTQQGGDVRLLTLWDPLKSRFTNPIKISSSNPQDFFVLLCQEIVTFINNKPNFLKRHDPKILVATDGHAFNLNPFHFISYWKNPHAINNLRISGNAIWNRFLDEDTMQRIVSLVVGSGNEQTVMKYIGSNQLKPYQFRSLTKKVLPISQHSKFDHSLGQALSTIPTEKVLNNIFPLLSKHRINLNQSLQQEIRSYFEIKTEDKPFLNPYELSKILHKVLISIKAAFISPLKLEEWICEEFAVPPVIDLGNLNWLNEIREKPQYWRLVIKYDYCAQKIIFCKRCNGEEAPLTENFVKKLLQKLEIFFES